MHQQTDDKEVAKIADTVRQSELIAALEAMREMALRPHYYCEDSWYSCPKAEHGCANDSAGDDCNCGADKHNLGVECLYAKASFAIKTLIRH